MATEPVKNGEAVAAFERDFAAYAGAKYCIALCNGTATLHTALVALGVKPGDRVAVPPLTMSATTIAVLHAGAVPVFGDIHPETWLLCLPNDARYAIPVSLYGLHYPSLGPQPRLIDDAAQTLRTHGGAAFTSYSFQASKILPLGEGGMLATNDEALAVKAREFSSLGYRMRADQPRIDPAAIKSPSYARHHSLGYNYRMNDLTARRGLRMLEPFGFGRVRANEAKADRRTAASLYADAIAGCDWLTPQYVPPGFTHDYWAYAMACDTPERGTWLQRRMGELGAEIPYGAWRLTYQEPAFRQYADGSPRGLCLVAENLQPRLLQFQTNNLVSAERNAAALRKAIGEIGG